MVETVGACAMSRVAMYIDEGATDAPAVRCQRKL